MSVTVPPGREAGAREVKRKALDFGADLVGIASVEALESNPPHAGLPTSRPSRLLHEARSVVVVAKRLPWGGARTGQSANRSVHYSHELVLTATEEASVELVYHLEEQMGAPSLVIPAAVSRALQADMEVDGPLSLTHAAVEAGLGTLGLNLMLLTAEFGPRVVLGGVITTADLEPDKRLAEALCLGPACGRCLLACPGDAIGAWALDVESCRPHSSPWGFQKVEEHFGELFSAEGSMREELARSTDTFMIWQSMLRGVGVYTGCTRCYDVCPVGDYQSHLADVLNEIPETTEDKLGRLDRMREGTPEADANRERWDHWIGDTSDPARQKRDSKEGEV